MCTRVGARKDQRVCSSRKRETFSNEGPREVRVGKMNFFVLVRSVPVGKTI